MSQTFHYSARYPDLLMLKLGACEEYGDIYLSLNSHNTKYHNPIIQYFEFIDSSRVYPETKEVDAITTCNWIQQACIGYTSYLGVHEWTHNWTSIYICALSYLDRVAANIDTLPRLEVIQQLKTYIRCDPNGTYMPLTHAKLEALLEEEAMDRLKTHSAKRIQCRWREVVVNPYHTVCQRRLMRELHDMQYYV